MKNLFYILSLGLLFVSCDETELLTVDKRANGPEIVGFEKKAVNVAYFSNVGVKPVKVAAIMQGLGDGQLPTAPITLSYSVDTANSTAVEGTEFNFTDSSRKITIPAGGTFANIPLVVNTGSLNATQKTELVLKLTATSGGVIGEQFKTVKVLFIGCATALDGTYRAAYVVGGVQGSFFPQIYTVIKTAPNEYQCDRFPGFGPAYFWQFSDVCKDLDIFNWQFQGGNPIFSAAPAGGNVVGLASAGLITPGGNLTFNSVSVTGTGFQNRNFIMIKQ